MPKIPHVLLLIESSRAYGRDCLMGIASYMRAHGTWDVLQLERGLQEDVPASVSRQRFDGVIARAENSQIAKSIARFGVPTVDLRGLFAPADGVTFNTDNEACGAMAVEHYRQRGFRHLAFCGYEGVDFSDGRRDAFTHHASLHGITAEVMTVRSKPRPSKPNATFDTLGREARGEDDDAKIAKWMVSLPKPVGIFACNDMRGRQVIAAGRRAGLRIPDQVAVLGVDNDEVICDLANPPLSSIVPDTHRLGFEGAAMLDQLMNGQVPEQSQILFPPRSITVRLSTDALAVNDLDLAEAIEFIRNNACDGIGVKDVTKATAISRTTLERRFREALERSPREEIERVRGDRIRVLLAETDYNLDQIASLTGYGSGAHLVTAFRRLEGCTPGKYRAKYRDN